MRPGKRADLTMVELPDDELVVSRVDGSSAVILNATGAAILELCDGQRSCAEIVAFICANVAGAVPTQVIADVDELLARLLSAGLIEDRESCGSEPSAP
jgi:hypothetical protein